MIADEAINLLVAASAFMCLGFGIYFGFAPALSALGFAQFSLAGPTTAPTSDTLVFLSPP